MARRTKMPCPNPFNFSTVDGLLQRGRAKNYEWESD